MLQIVVEVAGTVCDVDCSIFSQTVDRQRPPAAGMSGGQKPHRFYPNRTVAPPGECIQLFLVAGRKERRGIGWGTENAGLEN